jgi:hypothetical protein
MKQPHALLALCALAALAGCGRPATPDGARPWRSFVEELTNTTRIASLTLPGTRLYSSFDRKGGNDDYNNFAGPGTEKGWVLLAEAQGPGVVRRFWTTGADPGHAYRIYVDGERKPRISGAIDEVFGGLFPFVPPLARYMNLCWFSYVPITFQKSIRIEAQAPNVHPFWGPRRLFFQINIESLPKNVLVESFPTTLSEQDRDAVARAQQAWRDAVQWPAHTWAATPAQEIGPGETAILFQSDRPGMLREWTLDIQPGDPGAWSPLDREYLLQDALLRVTYDDSAFPSILAPVGDFFGNAWRRRHYGSLLLGSSPDGFRCRWPMPFARAIRVELVNGAERSIRARFDGQLDALDLAQPGYLHAEWRRSGSAAGQPHVIADLVGRGHFVGCFLGVTGDGVTQQDNSWWLLEGDERIFVDGEPRPSWHGTGLEDYFNGGWYYRGAAFSGLHGILDRAPFRVAQYRHQLVDPVAFNTSLRMTLERGDQNVSHAWFRSTAFAYLDRPASVAPVPDRAERRAEETRYQRQTMMLQLIELERMNNFAKAIDLIAEYGQRYPEAEENAVYALRVLEYRRLLGEAVTDAEYQPFLSGERGDSAAQQARLLLWLREQPNRALVGMNVNGTARLFLDNQEILNGDQPYGLQVAGVELAPGAHRIAAQVEWRRQDAWLMLGVVTADGFVGTGPGTRGTRQAPAGWRTTDDLATWQVMDTRDSVRGVPDAPFIGGMPNAFVLMQAKAYPVSIQDWGYHRGTAYFRLDVQAPVKGWPAVSDKMTGLPR